MEGGYFEWWLMVRGSILSFSLYVLSLHVLPVVGGSLPQFKMLSLCLAKMKCKLVYGKREINNLDINTF